MKKNCAILIPVYKPTFTAYESIALAQCSKILTGYDVHIVKPEGLQLHPEQAGLPNGYLTANFPDHYFKNVFSYNDLMLSGDFYQRFLAYEYILIYQLDAFVFKDALEHWCSLGYDYIGAPWLRDKEFPTHFKILKERIRSYLHRRYNFDDKFGNPDIHRQMNNYVGNGGFSLRKVKTFFDFCIQEPALLASYTGKNSGYFNEDMFWSIEVNRKKKRVRAPGYKEALHFSIETAPERAMAMNKGVLPFGCHAWDKFPDFWRPYFKEQGYTI